MSVAAPFASVSEPRPVPGRAAAVGHGGVLRGRVRKDGRLHGLGEWRGEHQARGGVFLFARVSERVFFLLTIQAYTALAGEQTRDAGRHVGA